MASKKYTLGKGRLAFKPDVNGVEGKSYLRLGNAPEFMLSLTIEKIEHFSSEAGLQLKDASIITKVTLMGTFTLDEPSIQNLKLFFMSKNTYTYNQTAQAVLTAVTGENAAAGTVNIGALGEYIPLYHSTAGTPVASTPVANASNDGVLVMSLDVTPALTLTHTVTSFYEFEIRTAGTPDVFAWRVNGGAWTAGVNVATSNVAIGATGLIVQWNATTGGVVGDRWTVTVNIPNTAGDRVFDLTTGTGTFELKDPTDTITYVEGSTGNYQVDRKAGVLYINPEQNGALVVAAITPADAFLVKAKWNAVADAAYNDAFTLTTLKGHLLFTGEPPVGEAIDVQGYVSLTPTGDFSGIGTDWMTIKFEAEYLAHERYVDSEALQGLARVTRRAQIG